MTSPNEHQLALRVPAELLEAIDAEVERVKRARPGARVQRSDIVREALMRAFFQHPDPPSGPLKRPHTNGDDASNGHDSDASNGHSAG
jgi:hypothetical protein